MFQDGVPGLEVGGCSRTESPDWRWVGVPGRSPRTGGGWLFQDGVPGLEMGGCYRTESPDWRWVAVTGRSPRTGGGWLFQDGVPGLEVGGCSRTESPDWRWVAVPGRSPRTGGGWLFQDRVPGLEVPVLYFMCLSDSRVIFPANILSLCASGGDQTGRLGVGRTSAGHDPDQHRRHDRPLDVRTDEGHQPPRLPATEPAVEHAAPVYRVLRHPGRWHDGGAARRRSAVPAGRRRSVPQKTVRGDLPGVRQQSVQMRTCRGQGCPLK